MTKPLRLVLLLLLLLLLVRESLGFEAAPFNDVR